MFYEQGSTAAAALSKRAWSRTRLGENWAGMVKETESSDINRNFSGTIIGCTLYRFSYRTVWFGLYWPKRYDFYNYDLNPLYLALWLSRINIFINYHLLSPLSQPHASSFITINSLHHSSPFLITTLIQPTHHNQSHITISHSIISISPWSLTSHLRSNI